MDTSVSAGFWRVVGEEGSPDSLTTNSQTGDGGGKAGGMAAILSVFQHEGAKVMLTDFKVFARPWLLQVSQSTLTYAHFTVARLETKTTCFQDTQGGLSRPGEPAKFTGHPRQCSAPVAALCL